MAQKSLNFSESHVVSINNTKHSQNAKNNAISPSNEHRQNGSINLPQELRVELHFAYDVAQYDLRGLVSRILLTDDETRSLGKSSSGNELHPLARLHLLWCFHTKMHGRPKQANRRWRSRGLNNVGEFHAELRFLYGQFVEDVIKPCVGAAVDDELVFQSMPVLRIQTPSTKSLGNRHRDEQYGRQLTEINIWLPLVDVSGTNSLWVESKRGCGDFHPFDLKYGQFARFWGSQCEHFTKANSTDTTRVSLDFRVILESLYVDGYVSPDKVNGKSNFYLGGAYTTTKREREWRQQYMTDLCSTLQKPF